MFHFRNYCSAHCNRKTPSQAIPCVLVVLDILEYPSYQLTPFLPEYVFRMLGCMNFQWNDEQNISKHYQPSVQWVRPFREDLRARQVQVRLSLLQVLVHREYPDGRRVLPNPQDREVRRDLEVQVLQALPKEHERNSSLCTCLYLQAFILYLFVEINEIITLNMKKGQIMPKYCKYYAATTHILEYVYTTNMHKYIITFY